MDKPAGCFDARVGLGRSGRLCSRGGSETGSIDSSPISNYLKSYFFTTPTWNLDRSIIINCSVEFFLTIAERVRGSKKLVRLKEPGKEGFANKSDRVEWIRDSYTDYKHNLINRYYIPNFMSADWRKGATYIQSRCNFRISSQHRSTSAR